MKKTITTMIAAATLCACTQHQNPFLTEWDTPYGIPAYDKISVDDYIPAIQAGIEQQQKEVDAIVACQEAPTFENTITPLELSGSILSRVNGVLQNITETDRTDEQKMVLKHRFESFAGRKPDNTAFLRGRGLM